MLITLAGAFAVAQDRPAPKWELFGGYSVFAPGADIHGVQPLGLIPVSSRLETNPRGGGLSLTYDFNRWFGLTLDASTARNSGETGGDRIDDTAFSNISFGPKITFRHKYFSPFLEGLVGDHRLMPDAFHDVQKLGFMAGGGLDIDLSRHFALRLIRADYVYSNYRYGPPDTTPETNIRGARLQSGLVLMWGGAPPPPPPTATCTMDPAEVFAGEPVTGHASGYGFNPKRTVRYSWSATGMNLTSTDAAVQIDSTQLPPGSYTISASLSDGVRNQVASCSARLLVKQPRPPEVSCAADPSTVGIGGTATIRSSAGSPDRRRLRYQYSASAGTISGNDATAAFTAGSEAGPITITCNVSDDRNPALTASAMTRVMVEAPPAPSPEIAELETKLALHSIYFKTARPTEKDPDAGLVESQQDVLAALAVGFNRYLTFKPDAHLTLGGHADSRGSAAYNQALTERRVQRAKNFLVEHGVPAGNVQVRAFGEEQQLTSDQVKQQIEEDPDLNADERRQILSNLPVIVLANNRRVDISLSTTGEQSMRRYPFNARDSLALISPKGASKKTTGRPARRKAKN